MTFTGFTFAVTVLLISFRFAGVLEWDWVWVWSPLWGTGLLNWLGMALNEEPGTNSEGVDDDQ